MAATTANGNKIDEAVGGKNDVVDGKSKTDGDKIDEAVGGKNDVMDEKSKTIELISSDGQRFEITHEAAAMSQTIHHMIEDDCVDNGVPLPNVTSRILALVIEYCNKHVATTGEQEDVKGFDEKFINVDQATLFDIILAANYLDIKELLDLSCQTVADMIKGKTVEEIRTLFNLKNDFTPEEEEEIRRENQWAFE